MDPPAGTNRHVPEFALVTGAFLSLSFLVAGLVLTGDVVRTVLTAVALLYPFAAYAVTHSPDPTEVLPPRITSLAAIVAGGVLAVSALLDAASAERLSSVPFALFLAALVVAPPAAYHVRYGGTEDELNPLAPATTVLATTVAAVATLGYGLFVGGTLFAAGTALLAFLGGAVYARARGERLTIRTRRRFVAGGAVVGVTIALVGLVRSGPADAWLLVGISVVAAPTLFYALTAPERA